MDEMDFNQMHVTFENEDYVYKVDEMQDHFQLPDGRILGVQYWIETNPVQPGGLHVVANPETIAKEAICQLTFEPKNTILTFEGMDYATTSRLFMAQYVLLPDNTVLEYDYEKTEAEGSPQFKRAENVNLQEQLQYENVLKAELKGPSKRFKL